MISNLLCSPTARAAVCLAVLTPVLAGATSARAQQLGPAPAAMQDTDVVEKLDQQIPLDLRFRDDNGREVTLGTYLDGTRPAILSLNYSDCPMLCTLVLNGMVDALREVKWTAGEEFLVISVSIDPAETPQRARLTKQKYVKSYDRPGSAAGSHFLTGSERDIQRLADAVGFGYTYVEDRKEFSHPAVLMLCTPDGRVSRYLYGIEFPADTMKMALLEAGQGKIGSTVDRVLMYCFHYDSSTGRYGPAAQNIMRLGGGLMLMVMVIGLVPYWLHRRARHHRRDREGRGGRSSQADLSGGSAAETPGESGSLSALCPPLLLAFLGAPGGSLFFPQRGSTEAATVDQIFYFILIISIVFFVLIVALMLLFVLKYRRSDERATAEKSSSHNNALEALWSIIPSILVAIIFIWGFTGYLEMRQAPDDSYEIQVFAKRWAWSFQYPNGYIDENLHVPADTPIRLVMSSSDVIHSLYVPAFRLKMDVVPGRYSTTWFNAINPGSETAEYDLFCAEYCGDQHSTMLAKVVVHPSGEFETWLEQASNFLDRMSPEEGGQLLYQRRGCVQCHSVDGSAKTGPTFQGTFGTQQQLADGGSVTVDENYIRESILDPMVKVRAGYKPVMPSYQGQLKEEEINAIIAYIKSLK
jgi:cytochrome c oxidase subunit 2